MGGGCALRRRAVLLRAVRPLGAPARDRLAGARILRGRAGRGSALQGRHVLQVSVPDRAIQLRRFDVLATRAANQGAGDLPELPTVDCIKGTRSAAAPEAVLQRGCE